MCFEMLHEIQCFSPKKNPGKVVTGIEILSRLIGTQND